MDADQSNRRRSVMKAFRFSPIEARLLELLADRQGLSQTSYLGVSLRRLANEAGIDVEAEQAAVEGEDR